MYCIYCNRLIIQKLKIVNLFKRQNDLLCSYCSKKLDADLELNVLPITNNMLYAFRVFNNSNYSNDIYYSKQMFEIFKLVDKKFKNYALLYFENERQLLNMYDYLDKLSEIYNNIIVIYH